MDQGGCELCGVDGTFRILIRIMLELELDRSMWSSKSVNSIHLRAKSAVSNVHNAPQAATSPSVGIEIV